jgi:hypothetical protein
VGEASPTLADAGEVIPPPYPVLPIHPLHDRQALPSLQAAGLQDTLTGTGGHALQEAVLAPTRNALRLPRSLHILALFCLVSSYNSP